MERALNDRDDMDVSGRAEAGHLSHLDALKDYKVADGEPDIRGWAVKTSDGVKLGKVVDLLVDSEAMKVRYMEVALDKKILDLDDDRHVLVPIGVARLIDDDDVVLLSRTAGDLNAMPEYRRGTITQNDERVIYDDEHFSDREFLNNNRRRNKDNSEYIVRVKEYVVRNDEEARRDQH